MGTTRGTERARPHAGRNARRLFLFAVAAAAGLRGLAADNGFAGPPAAERLAEEERAIARALESGDDLGRIEADVFLDPETRRMRAAVRLTFREASPVKTFVLCEELAIRDPRSPASAVRVFRRADEVYAAGDGLRVIDLDVEGVIPPGHGGLADRLFAGAGKAGGIPPRIITLSTHLVPFLPCRPGRFVESRITVRAPSGLRCLASGSRLGGAAGAGDVFASAGSHGVALTCGKFRPAGRVDASIPVNLFVESGLGLDLRAYRGRIRDIVDFFAARFGPAGAPELNLLFQRERFFGGCSFQGYAVVYVAPGRAAVPAAGERPPLFLSDSRWDTLAHEIAHQWWGGVVAARRMDDAWISEGLAQYSTLLFRRERLPGKQFRGVLERLYAGVARQAGAGTLTDAVKLAYLRPDPVAYQVIVYNKGALVFWMLQDLLGEGEMRDRFRRLLAERRFQCLDSETLRRFLAGNDPLLERFFAGWVGRAEVPAFSCRIVQRGVMTCLEIAQGNGPFVFPLRVSCRTQAGERQLLLPVRRARESFVLDVGAVPPRSVEFSIAGASR